MKGFLLIVAVLFITGCSGTGLGKRSTLMPDSLSIGYMQEQYKNDKNAWSGISVSATWEFK